MKITTNSHPRPRPNCAPHSVQPPSHAEIVREAITIRQPVAVSLELGYMVTRTQDRVDFSDLYGTPGAWSVPRIIGSKRDKRGRRIAMTAAYGDGSQLRYTWSDRDGARYRVLEGKK